MTSPVSRIVPAFGYDALANALVLYGGLDDNLSNTYLNDTWKFALTGTAWAALTPTVSPSSARAQMGFTYDSSRHKFFMWGGRNNLIAATTETDTFDVAANTWATVAAANPGGRQFAPMAYSPTRDRIVLFGGQDCITTGTAFQDTWEFNPGTNAWVNLSPATVPSVRVGAAMALNPSDGLVYMAGGASTTLGIPTFRTDTYKWTGTTWTLVNNSFPTPGSFAPGQLMAWSPANSTLIAAVANGSGGINTYLLIAGAWVQQTPAHSPPVASLLFQNMVSDGVGAVLLATDPTFAISVPWRWTGTDWIDLTVTPPTPPTPPPTVLAVPTGSPLQQIFTHVLDAQNRLLQQYKTQPNFLKLIAVFAGRTQVVENAIIGVYLGRTLSNAVGVQLDGIGKTVGLSRSDIPLAADDEVYRIWLKAWVRVNLSSGTIPDIIDLFKAVVPAGTTVQVFNSGTGGFRVILGAAAQVQGPTLVKVLNSVKAGGVLASIDYETASTPLFGFDGAGAGFDTGFLGGSV